MDILVGIILIFGLFFFTVGSIGILRLPDFFTRLHSAGMMDSLGLLLSMSALALYAVCDYHSYLDILTGLKIILIVIFVYITSPTATHAIVDAGVRTGLKVWTRKDKDL